jgi:hypothetical protein
VTAHFLCKYVFFEGDLPGTPPPGACFSGDMLQKY